MPALLGRLMQEEAPLRKRFVRLGAVRVAHYDEGQGPAVLFVHGIPTSCYLWRETIRRLRGRFRCLAPDLLGLGDTEGPPDADFSMPAQAELLRALLDEKGLARAHLVCHDQGGAAAQVLAARHPERIERWVITNSVAYDNWPVPIVRLLRAAARVPGLFHLLGEAGLAARVARSRLGFPRAVASPAGLGEAAIAEYLRPTDAPSRLPAQRHQARERLRRFALAGDARHTLAAVALLRRFPRPALVLWGAEDRFLPPAWGRRLADDLPHARLETVPGCGHFLPEERPELLAERIAAWCGDAAPA